MQLVQPSKFSKFRTRSIGMRACKLGLCCYFSNASMSVHLLWELLYTPSGMDPGIRRGGFHFPQTTPLMSHLRGGTHILGSN